MSADGAFWRYAGSVGKSFRLYSKVISAKLVEKHAQLLLDIRRELLPHLCQGTDDNAEMKLLLAALAGSPTPRPAVTALPSTARSVAGSGCYKGKGKSKGKGKPKSKSKQQDKGSPTAPVTPPTTAQFPAAHTPPRTLHPAPSRLPLEDEVAALRAIVADLQQQLLGPDVVKKDENADPWLAQVNWISAYLDRVWSDPTDMVYTFKTLLKDFVHEFGPISSAMEQRLRKYVI